MFDGIFQPMHLLVIFVIAMFVFGPKRFAELGKGLGDGIRSFKGAMNSHDQPSASEVKSAKLPELGPAGNVDERQFLQTDTKNVAS